MLPLCWCLPVHGHQINLRDARQQHIFAMCDIHMPMAMDSRSCEGLLHIKIVNHTDPDTRIGVKAVILSPLLQMSANINL